MPEEFQGKRVQTHEEFWDAGPGAYMKVSLEIGDTTYEDVWLAADPNGHPHHLSLEPAGSGHEVEEHEDGTISVQSKPENSNSILCGSCGWHGYIDHGVWRSV